MTQTNPTNRAASIRQRLLNLAKSRGEEFQRILTRYALERLLQRRRHLRHLHPPQHPAPHPHPHRPHPAVRRKHRQTIPVERLLQKIPPQRHSPHPPGSHLPLKHLPTPTPPIPTTKPPLPTHLDPRNRMARIKTTRPSNNARPGHHHPKKKPVHSIKSKRN